MAIPQPEPRDWQIANAQELQATDREVLALLRASKKRVDEILKALPAGQQEIRRAQLEQTRASLLAEQATLFERLGDVVNARRARSASRAARLSAAGDAALLALVGRDAQGQYLYQSALTIGQRAIDTALARMRFSEVPLSQRIYRTGVWMGGRLSKLINETLASGTLNAAEFAKRARDWFNPNTPGGVRYAAMRLARTEINNAFHAMSAEKYATTPWINEVEWNLSKSHPKPDICNKVHAESPYPADRVPARPHPQCLCYITPKSVSEEEFVDRFIAGEYDDYLDSELAKNGWAEPEPAPQPKPQSVEILPRQSPSGKTPPREDASAFVPHSGGAGNAAQRVQNLLSEGKTRAEIVESERLRGRPAGEADRAIDAVLVKNQVPSYAFPRKSDGTDRPQPKRDAKTVKAAPARSVAARPAEPKVETPAAAKSAVLLDVENRIDPAFETSMQYRIRRVLAIQESHVGSQINRIKKIQNGHDDKSSTALGSYAFKLQKISFRQDIHKHEADIKKSRNSGFKVHCGHDAIEGTIAHESGHAFLRVSDLNPEGAAKLAVGLTKALGLPTAPKLEGDKIPRFYMIQWGNDSKNREAIKRQVSQYAATSTDELIAEIWADYTMNPNPSPAIKSAGILLEELMKGLPDR